MDFRGSGPIRIGVSACLLGQEVRFDGGHTNRSIPKKFQFFRRRRWHAEAGRQSHKNR
jgi:uncharacterized protein YbbK (DUF523 family)